MRRRQIIVLALGLGVPLCRPPSVDADVMPPPTMPAQIVMSSSADFPEVILVVYRIDAEKNSKGNDFPADAATAKMIPAGTGAQVPVEGAYLVLAVPRALAEQSMGRADPAWLEPAAPGVIRVLDILQVPGVYYGVLLRYELVKTGGGPRLRLLNPEELEAATKMPPIPVDRSVDDARARAKSQPWLVGGLVGGGGLLVLAGGAWFWWRRQRRHRDNSSE